MKKMMQAMRNKAVYLHLFLVFGMLEISQHANAKGFGVTRKEFIKMSRVKKVIVLQAYINFLKEVDRQQRDVYQFSEIMEKNPTLWAEIRAYIPGIEEAFAGDEALGDCYFAGWLSRARVKKVNGLERGVCESPARHNPLYRRLAKKSSCASNGSLLCNPALFGEGICVPANKFAFQNCSKEFRGQKRSLDDVAKLIAANPEGIGKAFDEVSSEVGDICGNNGKKGVQRNTGMCVAFSKKVKELDPLVKVLRKSQEATPPRVPASQTPTPEPSEIPSPEPSESPSPVPSFVPSPTPTASPKDNPAKSEEEKAKESYFEFLRELEKTKSLDIKEGIRCWMGLQDIFPEERSPYQVGEVVVADSIDKPVDAYLFNAGGKALKFDNLKSTPPKFELDKNYPVYLDLDKDSPKAEEKRQAGKLVEDPSAVSGLLAREILQTAVNQLSYFETIYRDESKIDAVGPLLTKFLKAVEACGSNLAEPHLIERFELIKDTLQARVPSPISPTPTPTPTTRPVVDSAPDEDRHPSGIGR